MTTATRTRKPVKPAKPVSGTCRLTLSINGAAYTLTPIRPDAGAALAAWRLRKPDGTVYDLHADGHGHGCTCPHWTYRLEGSGTEAEAKGCKHLAAARACGLMG